MWDAATGELCVGPLAHDERLAYARLSADQRRVCTITIAGDAREWEVAPLDASTPEWLPWAGMVVCGRRFDEGGTYSDLSPHARASGWALLNSRIAQATDLAWSVAHLSYRSSADLRAVGRAPAESAAGLHLRAGRDASREPLEPREDVPTGGLRAEAQRNPTNALLLARLAHRYSAMDPSTNGLAWIDADFLSRRALQWAPDDPEVLRLRTSVLLHLGETDAAISLVSAALARLPVEADSPSRIPLLLARAEAMGTAGHPEAWTAERLTALGLPPRPRGIPDEALDLSPFYNAAAGDALWRGVFSYANASPGIPWRLRGNLYDARGVIRPGAAPGYQPGGESSRDSVDVPIRKSPTAIRLLVGTHGDTDDGDPIGSVVLLSANGGFVGGFLLRRDEHLVPWAEVGTDPSPDGANPGRRPEDTASLASPGKRARLHLLTWANPDSAQAIERLRLSSFDPRTIPFLIAISVESAAPPPAR